MIFLVDILVKIGCFVKKDKNIFSIKSSLSELVSTRKSTILSLPIEWGFPGWRMSRRMSMPVSAFRAEVSTEQVAENEEVFKSGKAARGQSKLGSFFRLDRRSSVLQNCRNFQAALVPRNRGANFLFIYLFIHKCNICTICLFSSISPMFQVAELVYLGQGGQLHRTFSFSKESLVCSL